MLHRRATHGLLIISLALHIFPQFKLPISLPKDLQNMVRRTIDEGSPSEEEAGSSETDLKSATVCFLCRQRKTKCDRTLPNCGFCIKAKVDCQYVPKPRKRGLRAGYVSQLENRIGKTCI